MEGSSSIERLIADSPFEKRARLKRNTVRGAKVTCRPAYVTDYRPLSSLQGLFYITVLEFGFVESRKILAFDYVRLEVKVGQVLSEISPLEREMEQL